MAYFMADWCMPSKWMEENILNQSELKAYFTQYFTSIKVNIDQKEGLIDQERYQVTTLPTILVFNAKGETVSRIEGIRNVAGLQTQLLDQIRTPSKQRTLAPISKPNKGPAIDFSHLNKPAIIPTAQAGKTPAANPKRKSHLAQKFGVELAIKNNYGTVVRHVQQLEKRINEKIYIRLLVRDGQKYYQILAGQYKSRREAFAMRSRLLQQDLSAKVVIIP